MFIHTWADVLPAALLDLTQIQQQIVEYVANVPGKRRPSITHATEMWGLDKIGFARELNSALMNLKSILKRRGVSALRDLD